MIRTREGGRPRRIRERVRVDLGAERVLDALVLCDRAPEVHLSPRLCEFVGEFFPSGGSVVDSSPTMGLSALPLLCIALVMSSPLPLDYSLSILPSCVHP